MAVGTLLAAFPGSPPAPPDRPGVGADPDRRRRTGRRESWSVSDPTPRHPSTPVVDAPARVAPFVALAVAVVLAGLFVVLAGSDASTDETADTPLLGQPAPEAVGELADGSPFDLARRKGELGRAQLLRVRVRAVPAGAPRARALRRPAGRARPTAPSCTRSCTTTTATDGRGVLRRQRRRLAGRLRRRRVDRRRVRRGPGARDVDHRSRTGSSAAGSSPGSPPTASAASCSCCGSSVG